MPIALRQSTASQEIPLGYFLDSTDGNTEETALTIANTDIKLWKFGATTLANQNSGGATHISNGIYYAVLDATDTDTVGSLVVFCHPAGALAVRVQCQVYEEAVFDALYAASAPGYLQPTVAGRTLDVTATGAAGIDWGNVENPTTANDLSGTAIQSVSAMSQLLTDYANNALDATVLWNTAWDPEVQSEVQDAIEVNHLDHLLAADYDPASKPGIATALLNELIESDAGVSRFTANALEQGPSGGGGVADWTADERTAIRTILGIPASGTTPDVPSAGALKVIDDFLDTEIAAILADTNELQTDWANGGRLDLILDSAASAGDPWSTALPGAYGAGTAGKIIGDNINAPIATVDTVVDAIKAKTDNLPSDPADQSAVEAAITAATSPLATAAALATVDDFLDTEIAAILADTNELQVDWVNGGRLDLLIDAIKAVTDKLDTSLELDGAVYRYTTNSLEQAPAGGGGGVADWNADERTAIRTILGIPASGTTPDAPSAGALKVIDDFLDTEIAAIKAKTDNLPTDPADASDIAGSFSTVNSTLATIAAYIDTEVAAILTTVDTEVAAIKAKTDNLPASPAAVGSAMTLATDAVSAAALSAAAVDEILDEIVEGSVTVRQVLRALLSLAAGKTARAGSTLYIRDFGDTKNRISLTVDSNADRTAVVTDLT